MQSLQRTVAEIEGLTELQQTLRQLSNEPGLISP
jgi:hypothetical protein